MHSSTIWLTKAVQKKEKIRKKYSLKVMFIASIITFQWCWNKLHGTFEWSKQSSDAEAHNTSNSRNCVESTVSGEKKEMPINGNLIFESPFRLDIQVWMNGSEEKSTITTWDTKRQVNFYDVTHHYHNHDHHNNHELRWVKVNFYCNTHWDSTLANSRDKSQKFLMKMSSRRLYLMRCYLQGLMFKLVCQN